MHGAVKGAVNANFGAVKGPKGAVVSGKRCREGLAGPGNPAPIGAQDSNQLSDNWRPGNQESGNENSMYMKLLTGFQIGICD
jgi:hypothetical protein